MDLRSRARRRPAGRRGAVLPVVMWLAVIVVVLALGLAYDTQLSIQSIRNTDGQARAYYAALSGIERLAAELDEGGVYYTAPGQAWERIDSDAEPISPEAEQYRYLVLAEDNCSRLDLNRADEAALGRIPELTEEQAQAILEFRGTQDGAAPAPSGAAGSGTAGTGTGRLFRSLDELLLLAEFQPADVYGASTWDDRLSPVEQFRRLWARMEAGETESADEAAPVTAAARLCVGARARQIASDGQPRLPAASATRDVLQERLEAVAATLSEGGEGAGAVEAALRIAGNRNVTGWSQVWGEVRNDRDAVRLLADVLTFPASGSGSGAGTDEGANGGNGNGGDGPGGGGSGGGGPGGGGPGGGGPGGGGPGGGPGGNGGGRAQGGSLPGAVRPAFFGARARAGFGVLLAQAPGDQPEAPGGSEGESGAVATPPEPLEGAVNLNTASAEVLMTLPQMTEPVAQAIVAYRDATPMVSRGDLLRIPEVTQGVFNAIIERVTVVSDSYTVRVLGLARPPATGGRASEIAVHLTASIDRTTGRCRIVRLRQDN